MKIVGIIPCRYGSKRFEGKPLMPILGKPMIQWVYERAKGAELLNGLLFLYYQSAKKNHFTLVLYFLTPKLQLLDLPPNN